MGSVMQRMMQIAVLVCVSAWATGCGKTGGDTPTVPPAPPTTGAAVCGGIQGEVCGDAAQYCEYGIGNCQVPDFQGRCEVKPQACTREFRPVCGCDGQTHSNACVAASMGTSVLHEGECP